MVTTLRITKVSDEDNGKYTLLIKNTAGETKADTMLDVMGKPKPPRIIKEIDPPELTLPGKKDLRLQCKIAGFPAPQIKWLRDGNEIKVLQIKLVRRVYHKLNYFGSVYLMLGLYFSSFLLIELQSIKKMQVTYSQTIFSFSLKKKKRNSS